MSKETDISLNDLFSTEEENQRLKAIEKFFNTEDLNLKTDLKNQHIEAITQIDLINRYVNDVWGIDLELDKATTLFKELRVSHDRKSRKEGVEMIKTFIVDSLGTTRGTVRKVLGI